MGATEPTLATWITLAVVGGFVWGGFAIALVTAVRKESGKVPPGG